MRAVQPLLDDLPPRRDPHQGLRARRRCTAPRRRSATSPRRTPRSWRASSTSCRSRPTTAPAAGCASRCARPRTARDRERKAINMAPVDEHRDGRTRELGALTPTSPDVDRARIPVRSRTIAAAGAAVRVLRGLRRLRRDAVRPAAHPALRRPAGDRQRHRLLVDLRRQPAHHPVHDRCATGVDRRGATRCSRTTPSSAWACASGWTPSSTTRRRCSLRAPRRPTAARRARRTLLDGRRCTGRRRAIGDATRRLVAELRDGTRRPTAPAHDRDARRRLDRARRALRPAVGLGRRRRRLGLRHRLRRARPRARLEPRRQRAGARHRGATPTPVASSPRRRPIGAVAKFASAGKETAKKDLGLLAMTYGHVYVASIAMQARSHQTVTALLGGRGAPGPVAGHRPQPVHRPRLRPGALADPAAPGHRQRARGRCTGSTPPHRRPASRRCTSTPTRCRCRCGTTCARRPGSAWSSCATPTASSTSCTRPSAAWSSATRSTSSSPRSGLRPTTRRGARRWLTSRATGWVSRCGARSWSAPRR